MDTIQSVAPESPACSGPGPVSAPRRRPFGLYAILILLSLQALLGVAAVVLVGLGIAVAPADLWATVASFNWGIGEPLLLLLVVAVVVVGLWRYRRWAWYGMMLLLAYWMAADAIGYYRGAPDYFSMVLNVAMVFYLNQHEVRGLFAVQPQQDGASA